MLGCDNMTTSIRIKAVGAILAITVFTVVAQAVKPQLATQVTAKKQTVRLGDPIIVSVRVTNQATLTAVVDRSATAFGCFEVTDADGKILPYVGFDGQVIMNRIDVQPLSTVMIADTLDLTDKYLFQKAGRYSIRFSGEWTGLSDSPAIAIEVTAGRLSEFDDVASSLLPICPGGWHLAKDSRGEVAPFGRSRVPGFALHLCHNHMHGEDVLLWFTKEEAKVDPNQQPRGKIEYLGLVRGLFVYGSVGANTPALWPTATEDIARALKLKK
jgi:hypothetical protein